MKRMFLISYMFLTIQAALIAGDNKTLINYMEDVIYSELLNEDRTLWIYTPQNYNLEKEKKYPVLYVLDGRYNFQYTVTIANYLYECDLIPELIIVGIINTNRNRDMLPTYVENVENSGGADVFSQSLISEINPFIDSNFRTLGYNILFGHSYSGLFTQYQFFNYCCTFNSYIAASPSVYWDNMVVMNQNNDLKLTKLIYNYFSVGSHERDDMVTGTAMLDSVLHNVAPENLNFKYEYMKGEDHSTTRLKTLYNGLEFTFKKWYYPFKPDNSNWNLDSLNSYYKSLSVRLQVDILPPEFTYYYIGYFHLRQENKDEALKTFHTANTLYPHSIKSYTNLATAYERTGNADAAIKYYKMALEIADKEDPLFKEIELRIEKIINEGVKNSQPL